ncbi:MAG: hypothetical protein IRZ03_08440 [Acidobacterium ailaaui]|nr:hypothetical protein [Pseudacidobacterium ailaaui]
MTQFAYARYALISTDNDVDLPGGDCQMKFPTTIKANPNVVPSQDFMSFTLSPGLWVIGFSYRLTDLVTNVPYLMIARAGANEGDAFACGSAVSNFLNGSIFDVIEFDTPTVIAPYIWVSSATRATHQGLDQYAVTHISFKGSV